MTTNQEWTLMDFDEEFPNAQDFYDKYHGKGCDWEFYNDNGNENIKIHIDGMTDYILMQEGIVNNYLIIPSENKMVRLDKDLDIDCSNDWIWMMSSDKYKFHTGDTESESSDDEDNYDDYEDEDDSDASSVETDDETDIYNDCLADECSTDEE